MAGAAAGARVYIEGYNQFGGVHWETGSVRNVLAHQGVTAGNGEPLSEAMLMGIANVSEWRAARRARRAERKALRQVRKAARGGSGAEPMPMPAE